MNHNLFWTLPGPKRFLDGLLADLSQARSAVVRLPVTGVPQFGACLQRQLGERGLRCQGMEATKDDNACEQLLCGLGHCMDGEMPQSAIRRACSGSRRVLLVTGIGPDRWPAWRSALMLFNHVARQIPQAERATLVLMLAGSDYADVGCTDVAVQYREWKGVVGTSDALCLADHLLPVREGKPRIRDLMAHTLATLAMWDCELVAYLAGEPLRTVLAPSTALAAYAKEKGWNGNTRDDLWLGTAGEYEGRQVTHVAVSVARGNMDAVGMALWRAQVSVLLPWVENERLDVVQRLVESGHAEPSEVSREIGELSCRYGNDAKVSRGLRDRIRRLRQVRNELAHGRSLAVEAILSA